jgi:hypothetical protein
MESLKVKELIEALSLHERKSFKRFLASIESVQIGQVMAVYEQLLLEEPVGKEELYKRVIGKGAYNDKKIRYLFSELSTQLIRFITANELQNNEEEYLLLQKRALAKRDIRKAFSYSRIKFSNRSKELSPSSELNEYRASEIVHLYDSKNQSRLASLNYEPLLKDLDKFYFLKKIQYQCELINLKNVLNKGCDVVLIDEILVSVKKNNFFDSPLIEIYYYILILLKDKEGNASAALRKIEELLNLYQNQLSVAELNNIYQYQKNFSIRMINRGFDQYRTVLFETYKSILANKRLMKHDYFSQWEFKNIVTLGLRLKEKSWVKNFIPKYINSLAPAERKNALTYNMAMWYYHDKNYHFVLKHLREVEFTDLYYQLDSRSILLKVYFETDDQETLLHHIAAFKIFLKRNKLISEYQLLIYRNFIKYSLKIFRAGTTASKLKQVRAEISSSSNISDRNWLIDRIDELLE